MNFKNKTIILLTIILSVFILNSCGEETKDTKKEETKTCEPNCQSGKICEEGVCKVTNKVCEIACESWETCNNGTCEITAGFCESDENCKDNADGKTKCGAEHKCEAEIVKICNKEEKRCYEDNVETCSTDGSEWLIEKCSSPQKCETVNYTCKVPEVSDCTALSFDNITFEEHSSEYGYLTYAEAFNDGSYNIQIGFYNNPVELNKTYDLGSGVNTDFSTCDQCVIAYDTRGRTEKIFFQESGSIKMEAGSIASGKSKGEVITVKLIEVTIDEDTFIVSPVNNGRCIEIEAGKTWAWDNITE